MYVAALVPDEGETVGDEFTRAPPHPKAPRLAPDEHGLLWVTAGDFRQAVAQDVTSLEAELLEATQKPIAAACLGEKMGTPSWRRKRSCFLIAENDRMVAPETQRFLATRMGSSIATVVSDHAPLCSHADVIADLVGRAAG